MQNISTLISQARAYGHEDTFSSTRRPRTREEFASPFSEFKQTLTLMGVISTCNLYGTVYSTRRNS